MTDAPLAFSSWIGRTETVGDDMGSSSAQAAAAMLDDTSSPLQRGDPLPPLWHWFYFLPKAPQSKLSEDGHPERGDFMPPVPLPRRMFAGARLRFLRPLSIATPAIREGVIRNVVLKSGRSGGLAFVTVGYRFLQDGELCLEEEQDIVYREPGGPIPPPEEKADTPAIPPGAWSRTVTADSRLLFRFSALTYNAHRIHYDRPYAIEQEGYPGLVVHGPLTAVLLMELVRKNSARTINDFSFRGKAPLFEMSPFRLVGIPDDEGRVSLEAWGPDGATTLSASAGLVG